MSSFDVNLSNIFEVKLLANEAIQSYNMLRLRRHAQFVNIRRVFLFLDIISEILKRSGQMELKNTGRKRSGTILVPA